jgi:C4-dicarboxylate-specific signal transduction histidine kinase
MLGTLHHEVLRSRFAVSPGDDVHLRQGTRGWSGEIEQQRRDGSLLWVSSRWQVIRTKAGRPWAVLETNTDITMRRDAEQVLIASERYYRTMIERLAVAILDYDVAGLREQVSLARQSGVADLAEHYMRDAGHLVRLRAGLRLVDANDAALRLFGEETRQGFLERYRHTLPFSDKDLLGCLLVLEGKVTTYSAQTRVTTLRGISLSVTLSASIAAASEDRDCFQVCITDLTESEHLADEMARMGSDLNQAMRGAMIGEISAIIAHEVNQPLAALKTYMAAARRWLDRHPANIAEAKAALDEALDAAGRAGQVVSQVRHQFERPHSESSPVAIDAMITDTLLLAMRTIREHSADLRLELHAEGATVMGIRALLQQSLLGLMINAIQAMETRPAAGKQLTIRSQIDDSCVRVAIEDTGPGFAPAIMARGADAFAGLGPGLGMGLAVCRSTVLAMGGDLEFTNCPNGTGAIVEMVLPMTK